MIRLFVFLLMILLCPVCYQVLIADNNHDNLNNLTDQIVTLKTVLQNEQSKRQHLQTVLEANETAAGKIALAFKETEDQLNHQQSVLNQLQQHEQTKKTQLQSQQKVLNQQLRTAYILERQPYLKLLFDQENLNHISRIMIYYKYLLQDQIQALQEIQQTLADIHMNQDHIKQQMMLLQNLKQQQIDQQAALQASRHERETLITTINKNILSKTQEMQTLLANKERLENTLNILVAHQNFFPQTKNFSVAQGKIPWPTKGQVQNLFGTKIQESELRWNGDIIQAPLGTPVYAIANGEVVFSKWLEGYGLLLIINHGDGYMTLYGRNQYLYKKMGDRVAAGDLIATVGNTGGYQNPALYFAIRHDAVPLDPATWCK